MKSCSNIRRFFIGVVASASLALPMSLGAAEYAAQNGRWGDDATWENFVVPDNTHSVVVSDGYTVNVTGTAVAKGLWIGERDRVVGKGVVTVKSGSLTVSGALEIGSHSDGVLNIEGGTFVAGGTTFVATKSKVPHNAEINITGGTAKFKGLNLGIDEGNTGSLSISGTGVLSFSWIDIGFKGSGTSGNGVMTVTGSTATVSGTGNIIMRASTLNFALDEGGISTVKATGNIKLDGVLNLSAVAGAQSLPSNVVLLSTTHGTVSGSFDQINWNGLSSDDYGISEDGKSFYINNIRKANSAR